MGPSRRIAIVSQAVCGALLLVAAAAAEPLDTAGGDPPADAVLATLPFDPTSRASTILIDLAPKGNARKLPFQLDTGATSSLVSPRLARSMGVKVSRTRQDPYRRRTALGRDVHFYVDTRRGDTASSVGIEYGVLGGDFLSDYVVELDFAQHRVRFLDPERYEVPAAAAREGEAVLPLALVANRPGLTLSLDGQPVEVLVDTGAQSGLMLSGEIAERAGIAFEPLPGFAIQGVVGRVEGHVGEVARLEIGPFAFERVAAVVAPNGFLNLGFPGDSLLGYDLLAQFLVRIDYPRRRLWLRRNEAAAPLPDPRRPETQQAMSWTIPPEPGDALRAEPLRDTGARQVWLEWRTPAAGSRVEGPVGWAAVEGWAGAGLSIRHDVVIAIDVSGSTAVASGADVDGDGSVGRQRRRLESWRTFNPHHLSSDVGDTVLAAEIAAARRLIEVLDPDRTRIGIVAFSDSARILAPLGSERERLDGVLAISTRPSAPERRTWPRRAGWRSYGRRSSSGASKSS